MICNEGEREGEWNASKGTYNSAKRRKNLPEITPRDFKPRQNVIQDPTYTSLVAFWLQTMVDQTFIFY